MHAIVSSVASNIDHLHMNVANYVNYIYSLKLSQQDFYKAAVSSYYE